MDLVNNPKFQLGKIVATPGALKVLQDKHISPISFLKKHQSGDWGNLCEEDKQLNNLAIQNEGNLDKQQRVFSSYKVGTQTIYIITEWNREITTLLLSSDY